MKNNLHYSSKNQQKLIKQMQTNLQFNKNTLIKKQATKLSLQIKFSQINSTWYEYTQTKGSRSPTILSLERAGSFQSSLCDSKVNQVGLQFGDKLQKLERELERQMIIIQKSRQLLKERIYQLTLNQLKTEKHAKQLSLKRRLQIQNLKRQVMLFIRRCSQQRQHIFKNMQVQLDRNIQQMARKYKKMNKNWKDQLKSIIQKMEGFNFIKKGPQKSTDQSKSLQFSLKSLQHQIKTCFLIQKQLSSNFSIESSNLIESLTKRQIQQRQKYTKNCIQLFQAVKKLQITIKSQIKSQHSQSEQNRQKIVLLFEENVQKIQRKRKQKQVQSKNRFKPPNLLYRHLK